MVNTLLASTCERGLRKAHYVVNEAIPMPPSKRDGMSVAIRTPDGEEVEVTQTAFRDSRQPGLYAIRGDQDVEFAVNLDPRECAAATLDADVLQQYGVRTTAAQVDVLERERQLRDMELEQSQKVWRWLIVGALLVLTVETLLAGFRARPVTSDSRSKSMIDQRLWRQLIRVRSRHRQLRWTRRLAKVWLAATVIGAALYLLQSRLGWSRDDLFVGLIGAAAVIALVVLWITLRRENDLPEVARRIEGRYPELRSALLAAIELHPDPATGRHGFMQERVVRQALRHGYVHRWHRAVPYWRVVLSHLGHLAALGLFVGCLLALDRYLPTFSSAVAQTASPELSVARQGEAGDFVVEPGNVEIERGSSLLVLARFQGIPTRGSHARL